MNMCGFQAHILHRLCSLCFDFGNIRFKRSKEGGISPNSMNWYRIDLVCCEKALMPK